MAGAGPTEDAPVVLVWDEHLADYDFGGQHPLAPVRVELTVDLIRSTGLTGLDHVEEVHPGGFDEGELLRFHESHYVEAVKEAGRDPGRGSDITHGLGPGDNPIFRGMHDAAMLVCAASKEAARRVWSGEAAHAFNPAGGLHHAMPGRAAGFCVYNDPAAAIHHLLEEGAERVGYVDVDVHHGDGVEEMFRNDPRVQTISLHESGQFLFPGTGEADDIGGPDALGSAANVPLHPGTGDELWLEVFDETVVPLMTAFDPDVLVTQLGCDTHATDPLAHLALTVDGHSSIYDRLHTLAHEAADGRWIATGGGGYRLVEVVPRAWTLAFAEMTGGSLPVETPMPWRERAHERTGRTPPTSFTDDPVQVSDEIAARAREMAGESVDAVRRLVLSRHGVSS